MKSFVKTPNSIFTFGEIDDFCKEWGWIHVKEFIEQKDWIGGHKPPYCWSCYGQGQFLGVDGNKYMTHNTYRMDWIGDIKNDSKNKEEFRKILKRIAGDYYGQPKREQYYFYDVELLGEQPSWKVILWHMSVSNGKMWEYAKGYEHLSALN